MIKARVREKERSQELLLTVFVLVIVPNADSDNVCTHAVLVSKPIHMRVDALRTYSGGVLSEKPAIASSGGVGVGFWGVEANVVALLGRLGLSLCTPISSPDLEI